MHNILHCSKYFIKFFRLEKSLDGALSGTILHEEKLEHPFSEVALDAFLCSHTVVGPITLILPSDNLFVGATWVPRLKSKTHKQIIAFEVTEALGGSLEDKIWSKQLIDTDKFDDCYLAVGINRATLECLCDTLNSRGVSISSIQTLPALTAWNYAQGQFKAKENSLWAHFEETHIHLFIREEDNDLVYRKLPLRANDLHQNLSWAQQGSQELKKFVTYFQEKLEKGPLAQIMLVGPQSFLPQIKTLLEGPLSIPVTIFSVPQAPQGREDYQDYAFLQALQAGRSGLLVQYSASRRRARAQGFVTKFAACFLGISLLGLGGWHRYLGQEEAYLVQEEGVVEQLNTKYQEILAYEQASRALASKNHNMKQFWQRRCAWQEFLAELSTQFQTIEDAWIDSLQDSGDHFINLCGRILARPECHRVGAHYDYISQKWETLIHQLGNMPRIELVDNIQLEIREPYVLNFHCRLKMSPYACLPDSETSLPTS